MPICTFQIDFARHVSNIVYVQWMEIGRLLLLKAVGLPVERAAESGAVPIIVETAISYKNPLRMCAMLPIVLLTARRCLGSPRLRSPFINHRLPW